MKPSVPILLYHHVSPEREITPAAFESQLRALLDQGYQALTLDDLVEVVGGKKLVEKPSFVLTFDDGYRDNFVHAFPILQKLSVPAAIYLVTERIGTDGFLGWEDVHRMAASGLVTFGSHTHTHRQFVRKNPYQHLGMELLQSKTLIERELNAPCQHLAWPWGDYETAWFGLVEKAGYLSCATTRAGANAAGTKPLELRRINVRKPGILWLTSRLRWNRWALPASVFGYFYGWDRRFKVWRNKETPYSHG